MDFVKQTKRRRAGATSPLDFNATAAADTLAFAKLKASGGTIASWNQFAVWMQQTHGIAMRGGSLWNWAKNRSQ
jgi:hypothetical protein